MTNQNIEKLIIDAIEGIQPIHFRHTLSFDRKECQGYVNGINAFWSIKEGNWDCAEMVDALSCVLLHYQPERIKDGEATRVDIEIIDTLCVFLNRRHGWISSFQNGWYGEGNTSSITGWLLGDKLRRMYWKAPDA
jgi:hypothetical protein